MQRSCGIFENFLTWNNIFHCNRGSGAAQSRSGNGKTDLGRCPSEVRRSKRTSVRKRPQDHTYESRLCGIRRRAAKYTLWSLLIRPPFRSELTLPMFYYSLSYQYRICKNFFDTFGILSKNVVKARSAEASIGGVVWRRRIRTAPQPAAVPRGNAASRRRQNGYFPQGAHRACKTVDCRPRRMYNDKRLGVPPARSAEKYPLNLVKLALAKGSKNLFGILSSP